MQTRIKCTARRRGAVLAIGLFLWAVPGWGSETVTVNKAFNGREIKLRVGGTLRVELEQAGATGYAWEVRNLDPERFELVSVETTGGPSGPEVTGAPVTKVWLIRAKQPGEAELEFLYYRPWEGEKSAADRFLLKVRIP